MYACVCLCFQVELKMIFKVLAISVISKGDFCLVHIVRVTAEARQRNSLTLVIGP